jgi:nitroimidazol reductase NimA-like FMN-containing flavoprotein (pyridoxamine 5'-phosphate oxidase superfamily)
MRRKDREVSNIDEIKSIIEKCKVCHLAMVDKGSPYVIPLNFGYSVDENLLTLFFHSAKTGRKIEILKANNTVCFEMVCEGKLGHIENPCNSGYFFESVHGFGQVEFIENVNEKCEALTLIVKHQTNQNFVFTEGQVNSVCIYKVSTKDFIGKKKPNPKNEQ